MNQWVWGTGHHTVEDADLGKDLNTEDAWPGDSLASRLWRHREVEPYSVIMLLS